MNRHALHRRYNYPFNVSAGVAGIVHGRVPAMLRIVLVAVLGAPADVVEVLAIRIDKLDGRAVAINVNDRPQWTASLDAAEEEALLLAIDAKVHVAGRCDVIEEHRIPLSEPLGEGFSPVTGLIRQIRTRVSWQTASQVDRVVAGETETDHAAPIVGDLQKLDADLLAYSHGSGAKGDTLAKALVPPGDRAAIAQPDVVTVNVVKRQRRQVVGTRARGSGRCNRKYPSLYNGTL